MKTSFILVLSFALVGVACNRSSQDQAGRYLRNGKKYLDGKDYRRAALQFRNAARLLPKDAEPQYELGLAYLADRNWNEAGAALYRATELNPKLIDAQVKLAELMVRSGDPTTIKEGEKRLHELLASNPANTDVLTNLALSQLALGQLQDAEEHLQEALRQLPSNLYASEELALVRLKRKDFAGAEAVLKHARAVLPESAAAAAALGQFYVLTGRLVDAEAVFQEAVRISSADPLALLGLGAVETQLGKKSEAEETYRKLAGLRDKGYEYVHAAFLVTQGQREAGTKEFEQLAKAHPGDRGTRTRLVAAYLVTGRVTDAERVLAAALKNNANDVDALLQRSQILAVTGRDQEGENDLNRVIHFKPDSAEAHYLLARVYQVRGDASRHLAELTQAVQYDPVFLPARLELAQMMSLSGSPNGALEILESAPPSQKGHLAWLLERNVANLAAGDHPAFREGVGQAMRAARTPDVLMQDAVAKFLAKDYTAARISAEQALKQNPISVRALQAKVYSYTAQGQTKEAVKFLEDYASQSKSAAVQEYAGEWLWSEGYHDQGRSLLNRAKATDTHYAPADVALAQADMAEGKLDQARAALNRVLTADPRNFAAHVYLASLETQADNPQAAIEQYGKALEQQPNNVLVLNNLAYTLVEKANQPDQALTYAQQALELAPSNANAAGTLGWVYFCKGLYRNALPLLMRASNQDGNSTQPNAIIRRYHLAMTYLKLGERQKGLDLLIRTLQQNPNLAEAKMAQALLR